MPLKTSKLMKKLSPARLSGRQAPFAFNGSALAISSLPPACGRQANAKGELKRI